MRQKEQELLEIIQKLETDEFYAIRLINADNYQELGTNLTGSFMIQKYGTVEAFFESLISKGVNRIGIQIKRSNGSNYVFKNKNVQIFTIGDNMQVNEPTIQVQPTVATPPQPAVVVPMQPALNAPVGLGEMISLHVAASEKVRLETENRFLTEEVKKLRAEVETYKEEKLKSLYDTSKSESTNKMLTNIVEKFGPALAGMLSGSGGATSTGLNGQAQQQTHVGSEKQNQAIVYFSQKSDDYIQFVLGICNLLDTDTAFYHSLIELTQKYNESGNNND
ncbi:hypothetical protein [Flavobacterium sp. UBA4197]|uniref:hypothetical protein n=1 Tax=Flavobacterium sp. UBA4197 TaxID=1946546 RepID=UPI0025800CBF|nr:hypothetical protein [Flavobacterium sp. UBA4197]HRB72436.1 hypothetical protein [Flavobacterium sp.]